MSSHLTVSAPRRVPRQQRGRRRVERLLQAAEQEIAKTGYQAATMCAIAHRGGSCVGSLYQFFANKEAIVEALRTHYVEEHREFWNGLRVALPRMSVEELADRLLGYPIAFASKHPAFLALLDLPATDCSQKRRALIRDRIAETLRRARPSLSRARSIRAAAVIQQITRGCLLLYARADIRQRQAIVQEFRVALESYLGAALGK